MSSKQKRTPPTKNISVDSFPTYSMLTRPTCPNKHVHSPSAASFLHHVSFVCADEEKTHRSCFSLTLHIQISDHHRFVCDLEVMHGVRLICA